MKRVTLMSILAIALTASVSFALLAQDYSKTASAKQAHQMGPAVALSAKLIDPEKKAKEKAATIQVTVKGISLIDPASVNERPRAGQGHLHYRVDDGPVIATTTTKLSFHDLAPGQHRITVMLAGNDHQPLGPQETLTVTVP